MDDVRKVDQLKLKIGFWKKAVIKGLCLNKDTEDFIRIWNIDSFKMQMKTKSYVEC